MRIATSQLYNTSVSNMENQQSQLLQIEQQISSGVALTNPADDPLGAAEAVQLSATSATLSQYTTNQNTALSSLQTEDTTLQSITTTLQSANSLMQEAAGGTLNNTNYTALAQQLEGYRNQLLSLANTTDGQGNYVFAGFQSTSQVFSTNSAGAVTYNGDSGQRLAQVSSTRQIAVGDTGSAVFMSVPSVGSAQVPAGNANNTGTGTIGPVTVTDSTASTNNDNYSIAFSDATGTLEYTVTDNSQPSPGNVVGPTAYTAGSAIQLGSGMNVTISGTPASGDSFSVTPGSASANSNIFQTLDNVINALNTPSQGNTAASTNLTNALTTGMTALSNSLNNVITIHASVGGREQEVTALQSVTSTSSLQTTTNLSNITSTDMTSAISQYTELENALTASQKSFATTQGLSLFQYINP
ncbi:flagellar hook-associated protein FlgL [Paraburkholderia sp. J12]|uniref:flagellar hook-associated protein FlgL n=1 Tax=Paraburkholderia sp. J12 TaxID=2805432 RepID=UPI002ABD6A40|nr:flagellar hook-associated protein FlgL [Paraburkholderia sp. J12]